MCPCEQLCDDSKCVLIKHHIVFFLQILMNALKEVTAVHRHAQTQQDHIPAPAVLDIDWPAMGDHATVT